MARAGRDPVELLNEAKAGSRVALARLLTMIERGGPESAAVASLAYREAPPYSLGLTGAPGAGKSTLTDQLISVVRKGWPGETITPINQVSILAIDPTSPFSGGAILGDRVRMQDHATDPTVFIRSMATRGHLGGLSLAVPEAVRLFGAAGMPVVLIETVGVGQMEVEVASATDTTVVVVNPGWGDSMQANKAGLLCDYDSTQVCSYKAQNSLDTTYSYETGPMTTRVSLLDSSNTAINFNKPAILEYTHRGTTSNSGKNYDGKKVLFQYQGPGNLRGFPQFCIDSNSGLDHPVELTVLRHLP
jgi:hypothetical protein